MSREQEIENHLYMQTIYIINIVKPTPILIN